MSAIAAVWLRIVRHGRYTVKGAALKATLRLADNRIVRRSGLLITLLVASSAVSVAGVGYWVDGGADFGESAILASATSLSGNGTASETAVPWLTATTTPGWAVPSFPEYIIRRTVPEVRLQFTVADERGRLVPDIAQSDIRIFDDNLPVRRIQQFEKVSDLPLHLGLLLDVSDSMKGVIEPEISVALAFMQRVVRPGADRAFIMTFGEGMRIWQDPTSEVPDLTTAVQHAQQQGDATDFFDAMYAGCVDQWRRYEAGLVHRVIVVISDGEDTGSRHGLDEVIAAAQKSETQIYALSLHQRKRKYPGDAVLQRIADETGGRFFLAKTPQQADSILSRLEKEMRTQYYVSFRPQVEKPGYHAVQIELKTPRKLLVHARHGYYVFVP